MATGADNVCPAESRDEARQDCVDLARDTAAGAMTARANPLSARGPFHRMCKILQHPIAFGIDSPVFNAIVVWSEKRFETYLLTRMEIILRPLVRKELHVFPYDQNNHM